MIIDKKLLINFGKFLFRSGEESYKTLKDTELNKNIEEYIEDTFKKFIENARNQKEGKR